jgi:hypothetical protein
MWILRNKCYLHMEQNVQKYSFQGTNLVYTGKKNIALGTNLVYTRNKKLRPKKHILFTRGTKNDGEQKYS